jgi:hypothetical protein
MPKENIRDMGKIEHIFESVLKESYDDVFETKEDRTASIESACMMNLQQARDTVVDMKTSKRAKDEIISLMKVCFIAGFDAAANGSDDKYRKMGIWQLGQL